MENQKQSSSMLGKIVGPALAAIPGVGGVLAAIWNEWDTSRRFKRVEEFLCDFRKQIETISAFNPKEIEDKDIQILEEIIRRVQIEHREVKRKRFANLLVNSWTENRNLPFEDNMRFVRALDEFDDIHINILMLLSSNEKCFGYSEIGEKLDIPQDKWHFLLLPPLEQLASKYGFIKRGWNLSDPQNVGPVLRTTHLSPEGIARKCEHTISPMGNAFLSSIKNGNSVAKL